MDILEKKTVGELDYHMSKIVSLLRYKEYPLKLNGSSAKKSQKYFADYDFFTEVYDTSKNMYEEFLKKIKTIKQDPDITLDEFKIQTYDEDKIRWYDDNDFKFKTFNQLFDDIDYMKLDLICFIESVYIEVSCIYKKKSDDSKITGEEQIENLKEDIKELTKEKKYYKILKRKFSIYAILDDKEKVLKLTKIFNSDLGEKYKKMSNLEALDKLLEKTDDPLIIRRIVENLKTINIEPNITQIKNHIEILKNEVNEKAKKLNEKFKI